MINNKDFSIEKEMKELRKIIDKMNKELRRAIIIRRKPDERRRT